MAPPRIKVRGAARAKGIPQGYLLGRVSPGNGDVELLKVGDLGRVGLASSQEVVRRIAAVAFLDLTDTPAAYTGAAGQFVAVKATEDGLEFVAAPSGGGSYVPTVDGAEPPGFITDGAGHLIFVSYTP